MQNPDYYKEVADKCLERASKYDIKVMVEQYISVYNAVSK